MKTADLVEEIFCLSNCAFLETISDDDIEMLHELFDNKTLRIQREPARTNKKPEVVFFRKTPYNSQRIIGKLLQTMI